MKDNLIPARRREILEVLKVCAAQVLKDFPTTLSWVTVLLIHRIHRSLRLLHDSLQYKNKNLVTKTKKKVKLGF